jgi:glutathione peroxidase
MYQIFTAILSAFILQTSIYTLSFAGADGASHSFSGFEGKKILVVNIATNSSRVGQLAGLQQLQQQYGDSLVIIAFPSNSFGSETRTSAEVKQFCQSNYNAGFLIASTTPVTGAGAHPVFNWLSSAIENGAANTAIIGDFQKFLIDKEGNLVGIYSPSISPTDPKIINAITH